MNTEQLARAVDQVAVNQPDLLDRLTIRARETREGKRPDTYTAAWAVADAITQAATRRRLDMITAVLTRMIEVAEIDPDTDRDALTAVYANAIMETTQ